MIILQCYGERCSVIMDVKIIVRDAALCNLGLAFLYFILFLYQDILRKYRY